MSDLIVESTGDFTVETRAGGTVEYVIKTNNPDGPIRVFSSKGKEGKRYRLMHGRGKGKGQIKLTEREICNLISALPSIMRIEGESEQ